MKIAKIDENKIIKLQLNLIFKLIKVYIINFIFISEIPFF